jgi:outer membrane protein OmpA-like peptidoglycan-associated protein
MEENKKKFKLSKSDNESKDKSKFKLSKSEEEQKEPSKFNLTKSAEEPQKFDLGKKEEEPKGTSKVNITKIPEEKLRDDQSHSKEPGKATITSTQKHEKKKSKMPVFAWIIAAVVILVIGIYFITKNSGSSDQSTAVTEQAPINQQPDQKISSPSNTPGTDKPTGAQISDAAGTQTGTPGQTTESSAVAKPVQGATEGAANQSQQAQPDKTKEEGQSDSKPAATSASNIPYKFNETYQVYQFPFNESKYTQSDPELDKLVQSLATNPNMKISISAFSDNIGDPAYNQYLSDQRAKSIRDYIVSKGIDAKRITHKGKGISTKYPKAADNRRAEFILTE